MSKGILYIVATPIGNLMDLSPRAQETLSSVDLVVAEDTRHSQRLLNHFGIKSRMLSMHEHNEEQRVDYIIEMMLDGKSIAQISDAGTPLVNDPGFRLALASREAGLEVTAIPGATAPIVALTLSGLAVDRFSFEGFLPTKQQARERSLQELSRENRTMIFFESPRRILATLEAMSSVFGEERKVSVARELTKMHESVHTAQLVELIEWIQQDPNRQRGEFVVVVEGAPKQSEVDSSEAQRIVKLLAEELPPRKAAAIAAEITGLKKNALYRMIQLSSEVD
ncbi:MAG: 16S rRNA (cytidine(1402)-2'-O)-methyltransferase [Thiotrichales bacterium]|nr:16S rRNA (cytidine(1402)-2'-O)-methyltransferase [Thiotrichales bacterium]MBT3613676.1 16S rRNA (cytidine(1402)-2'-O)-methyltransferase [Thiotrichales bacterium]MBT3753191.1 16S rRNA (cytidine(1402)-2'-O)-methyltransferase [Thiotrichales bacterium]MBT3837739.1 16S rRNA (cytidine(1402)-2'-O)-methyltransferase [Thiotrichales bacterium]MBT4152425.1 16S rRNA (cytidine(1402)-2'-O)-methyltransferase [Thiotrichales bacterium]